MSRWIIRKLRRLLIFSGELTEMMGDLFIGHDMPEPPKESFFRGLFGGGSRSLDREELCKLLRIISFRNISFIFSSHFYA